MTEPATAAARYRTGRDASDPSGDITEGQDVACGYLPSMTPHAWSLDQWNAQSARWRLPTYVINPAVSPQWQAQQAVYWLGTLKAPDGIVIAADLETLAVPPGILDPFADELHRISTFRCAPYGSTSSLFQHSPQAGYWVADPTNSPHMYGHPHVIGTQWQWTDAWDENLFVAQDGLKLWDTRPDPEPGTEQVVPAKAWTRLVGTDAEILVPVRTSLRVKVA